jgi:hypothetical protein
MTYSDKHGSKSIAGKNSPLVLCAASGAKTVLNTLPNEQVVDWGLRLFDIPAYWQKSRGAGVKIAVLDTGVAPHPDLEGAIAAAVDFTNSPFGAVDVHGHGTHVVGILAARATGKGVIGVAPEADLYSAKVVNDKGVGDPDALVQGIQWAMEQQVDLLSISLSCKEDNGKIQAAIRAASEQGIYIFAAAGNSGEYEQGIHYPARCPEVITVGAIDQNLHIMPYSSEGEEVDVVAPGQAVLSTHPFAPAAYPKYAYARWNGTSMAVPFVAGLLALFIGYCRQQRRALPFGDYRELRVYLHASSMDLGTLGRNLNYGCGVLEPRLLFKRKKPHATNQVEVKTILPITTTKTLPQYPLQLYVIWESADEDAPAEYCSELAKAIFSTFHRRVQQPTERGMSIPVYFISTVNNLQTNIHWQNAEQTLIVCLVTDSMVSNRKTGWDEAIQVFLKEKNAVLVPVALTRNYSYLCERLNAKPWIKLMEREAHQAAFLVSKLALVLLQQLQPLDTSTGQRQPMTLFISYVKSDGKPFAQALRRTTTFFELPLTLILERAAMGEGDTFDAKTQAAIKRSIFLVISTKDYHNQEHCLKKLLFAKREQRPITVLHTASNLISREGAYLGNTPTLHWPSETKQEDRVQQIYLEVITPILLEAVRSLYQGNYLRTYNQHLNKKAVTFATAPELLTLCQQQISEQWLLYPDPPLGAVEMRLLATHFAAQIITPTLYPIRWVCAEEDQKNLKRPTALLGGEQILVGFSISEITQSVDTPYEGISHWHLQDALVELTRYALACGARCAYGGRLDKQVKGVNFMEILAQLLKNYNQEKRSNQQIYNHIIRLHGSKAGYNSAQHARYANVIKLVEHDFSTLKLETNPYPAASQALQLSYLRRLIFSDHNEAQIFIGGKLEGYQGLLPGILEEAYWALYQDGVTCEALPIYILGGFGGAAATLAELFLYGDSQPLETALKTRQQQPDWNGLYANYCTLAQKSPHWQESPNAIEARTHYIGLKHFFLRARHLQGDCYLDNGLNREENETLFQSTNILQISSLVLKGLYNYFILRK